MNYYIKQNKKLNKVQYKIDQTVTVKNGMYDYEQNWAKENGYNHGSGKFLSSDSIGKIVKKTIDAGAEYYIVNINEELIMVNRARIK